MFAMIRAARCPKILTRPTCLRFTIGPVFPFGTNGASLLCTREISTPSARRPEMDEDIKCNKVKFVDANGKFHGIVSLRSLLSSYDRSQFHLINVTPGAEVPTCKIQSKKQLQDAERRQRELRKERRNPAFAPAKEFEVSWGIAPHDLTHRVANMSGALARGYRIEVHCGSRKGSRRVDQETRQNLIQQLRVELNKVAKEWRLMVGTKDLTVLYFQKIADTNRTSET